jgi:23S rRNA (adenine2503-C2)-methyltransferase
MIDVMGLSARAITVSTVGVVPGVLRLAREPWPVGLAVSLHATDDRLRSTMVPLNDRYPIDAVVAAAREFRAAKGRRVSIEWTLVAGVNDTTEQAAALAAIARRMRAHVNVIPLNPTPLSNERPPREPRVAAFLTTLAAHGVAATRRDTRGKEIDAACGQLRLRATGAPGPVGRPGTAVDGEDDGGHDGQARAR